VSSVKGRQSIPCMVTAGHLGNEAEITSTWRECNNQPMISIFCATYNHEKFIEQAIIGFLSQKTQFSFEVVIRDDASTDATKSVIEYYASRYPNIIRPFYNITNEFSEGKRPLPTMYPHLRGKYVALCEGDDYWLDSRKLETQVSFLENNPEFVLSGHDAFIVDHDGSYIQRSKLPFFHKRNYSSKQLKEGRAFVLTLTMVFRRVLGDQEALIDRSRVTNGDVFLLSLLGRHGGAYYHTDLKPAAYRVHPGGIWSSLDGDLKMANEAITFNTIGTYYQKTGDKELAKIWFKKARQAYLQSASVHDHLSYILSKLLFFGKFQAVYKWLRFYITHKSEYSISKIFKSNWVD